MHAFLLIGDDSKAQEEAGKLAAKLKARLLEFPLKKIEEVRQLNLFVGLSLGEATAIFVRELGLSTLEALNAFLKNLEEPQEGLYYILAAQSLKSIPETIVSRCEVRSLKVSGCQDASAISETRGFLESPVGEKLAAVSRIRDRQEARDFVTSFILGCHSLMLGAPDPTIYSRAIKVASFSKRALEANGNVTVQLANLAVSLV
jgi:hypothetical protein